MTREQAIRFVREQPYKIGHMVGFTDLKPMHNEWIKDMTFRQTDMTLQAHRGSYKTTCVSLALSLIIMLFPDKRTLFMRKSGGDVREVMRQVQKLLCTEHMQYISQCIYGERMLITESNVGSITTNLSSDVKGTSQLSGTGTATSLTGKHYDIIFTDDIVNINDRVSKSERERTKLVYQELQNIKNRDGRLFNTGTPWHKDDCFSIMAEPKKFDCYTTGMLTDENIQALKAKMAPSLFAANYELRHIAAEDIIFDNPQTGYDPSLVEQGIGHVDAAYYGSDYTAYTICRRIEDRYFVFGKAWRKHIDDVEDEIVLLQRKFNAGKLYCEDNGDKGYLAKSLKAKGVRAVTYTENENKYLKIVSYLKDVWENVYFVKGTDEEYINQICEYHEHAENDDTPDSLASAIRILWRNRGSKVNLFKEGI